MNGPARGIAQAPAPLLAAQFPYDEAWARVQGKMGMAGVDGVSTSRYARQARTARLLLERGLASGRYAPAPLRLVTLAKRSGGERCLLIPAVVDRVAQTAAALWLAPRWNPGFDPNSYAYRPGMGVSEALRQLAKWRDRGFRWVLDADIRTFFDSIGHAPLVEQLELSLGGGSPLTGWIRQWLAAGVWDGERVLRLARGVPQGSPLSPLLANFYLDGLDRRLRAAGARFVRYADDFLVVCRSPFEVEDRLELTRTALAELGLELHAGKTRFASFETGFRFLGAEVRGDSILLPFGRKKASAAPRYRAPVMPRLLLRAWREGRLPASGVFDWQAPAAAVDEPDPVAEPSRAHAWLARGAMDDVLRQLRGEA
jgi:CRISPR-associated protein Cas1